MISKELLTIYSVASIRKYIEAAGVGIQVAYLQMGDNGEAKTQDEVQVTTAISFPRRGSATETYAIVNVTALVKTKIVPTDVYYHTRIKARVAEVLDKCIPVLKVGGLDAVLYDKSQVGILRRCPTETMTLHPAGIDIPDASVIEAYYEFQES